MKGLLRVAGASVVMPGKRDSHHQKPNCAAPNNKHAAAVAGSNGKAEVFGAALRAIFAAERKDAGCKGLRLSISGERKATVGKP